MARSAAAKKDPPPVPPGILLTMQPGVSPDSHPEQELETGPVIPPDIEEAFDRIPADTMVEVYHYGEDGEMGIVGKIPAQAFTALEVARRWRLSGRWRAIARIKDPKTGQTVTVKQKVFHISEAAIPEIPAGVVPVSAGSGAADGALAQLVTLQSTILASVTTALSNVMTAMSERKNEGAGAADPLAMMDKVASIVEKLAPKQTPGPENDLAARMVAMVSDVLDVKDRLNPPPSDEDPLMRIARENVPRLLGILEKAQATNPDAAKMLQYVRQQQATAPATPPGKVAGEIPAATKEDTPMWQLALAGRKNHLLQMAQRDKDPQTNAEYEFMLMEGTPVVGQFKVFLSRPYAEVVQDIFAVAPEFTSYEVWTVIFVVQLQELFGLVPDGSVDELMEGGEGEGAPGAEQPQVPGTPAEGTTA